MTAHFDKVVEAVHQMRSEGRDAIARWLVDLADESALEPLDAEDLAAIEEGLAQIERGEFATDEEVAAAFRRFTQP